MSVVNVIFFGNSPFLSVITEDTARHVLSWFDSQATQSARDFLRLTDSSQENEETFLAARS